MNHKQKVFNGLLVKLDPVDNPPNYSVDCANVNTFTKGALKNITGIEKQHTTAFGSSIMAMFQLKRTELFGGYILRKPTPVGTAIHNVTELQAMQNDLAGNYYLANDIDASDTINWNAGAGFAPVVNFAGIFDGNGHTITGLYINRPSTEYVGLFGGIVYGADIKNVGLLDVNISGNNWVGGLTGQGGNISVKNCYSTGAVTGNGYLVGGLVGDFTGSMENCHSTVNIISSGNTAGGLIGRQDNSSITKCYATGAVTGGGNMTGGLVAVSSSSRQTDCYATGAVTGSGNDVGGLIGVVGGTNPKARTNCYSTGAVTGGGDDIGGLIGRNSSGTFNDCFWDTETSGQATSGGGTGKTTIQMKQEATFTNWDFSTIWDIVEGVSYPTITGDFSSNLLERVYDSAINKSIFCLSGSKLYLL